MSAGRDERAFILLLLICYFPWLSSVCFFLSSLSLSQSRSRAHPTECILRFLLPRLFPAAAARSCSSLFLTRLFPPRSFLLLRHAAYISQWFLSNSLPLPLPLLLLLGFVCPNLLRNRPAVNNASPNGIGFVRVCGKVGTRKDHQIVSYPTYFISRFAIPCFIIESCIMDDHHAGWR